MGENIESVEYDKLLENTYLQLKKWIFNGTTEVNNQDSRNLTSMTVVKKISKW